MAKPLTLAPQQQRRRFPKVLLLGLEGLGCPSPSVRTGDATSGGMPAPDGAATSGTPSVAAAPAAAAAAVVQREGCGHVGGQAELSSYEQAPASARWVWDRLLQQDAGARSAATVERHMLHALDKLGFGTATVADSTEERSEAAGS